MRDGFVEKDPVRGYRAAPTALSEDVLPVQEVEALLKRCGIWGARKPGI
jgi:hypothetical protein